MMAGSSVCRVCVGGLGVRFSDNPRRGVGEQRGLGHQGTAPALGFGGVAVWGLQFGICYLGDGGKALGFGVWSLKLEMRGVESSGIRFFQDFSF